jgi:Tol biopolymer transport system component
MRKRIFFALLTAAVVLTLSSCMSMFGIKRYPNHRVTEEGALEHGYESEAVVLVGTPVALNKFPGGRVDSGIIMRGNRARFVRLTPAEEAEDAAFAYKVSFKDGRSSSYPIYTFADIFPVVSPDKSSLALVSINKDNHKIYIDGREETYDSVFKLDGSLSESEIVRFSPDSKHHAFVAQVDGKKVMVYDWEGGPQYEEVRRAQFSPDSKKFAYIAEKDDKTFVVINGKEGKHYDGLYIIPIFSPDSSSILYWAQQDEKTYLMINNTIAAEVDKFDQDSLSFDKDGSHITYRTGGGADTITIENPLT